MTDMPEAWPTGVATRVWSLKAITVLEAQ